MKPHRSRKLRLPNPPAIGFSPVRVYDAEGALVRVVGYDELEARPPVVRRRTVPLVSVLSKLVKEDKEEV